MIIMWTPWRGLLGGGSRSAKPAPAPVVAVVPSRALAPSPATPLPTPLPAIGLPEVDSALDGRFSALLLSLGQLRLGDADPTELIVLHRLEELVHARGQRDLLPRLPAVPTSRPASWPITWPKTRPW